MEGRGITERGRKGHYRQAGRQARGHHGMAGKENQMWNDG